MARHRPVSPGIRSRGGITIASTISPVAYSFARTRAPGIRDCFSLTRRSSSLKTARWPRESRGSAMTDTVHVSSAQSRDAVFAPRRSTLMRTLAPLGSPFDGAHAFSSRSDKGTKSSEPVPSQRGRDFVVIRPTQRPHESAERREVGTGRFLFQPRGLGSSRGRTSGLCVDVLPTAGPVTADLRRVRHVPWAPQRCFTVDQSFHLNRRAAEALLGSHGLLLDVVSLVPHGFRQRGEFLAPRCETAR